MGERSRALLVHHAEPSDREIFGDWMRNHSNSSVRVRTSAGEEGNAIIFRVRMCFGRGLILLDRPMRFHERDALTILL
jgi:hypothetical protein